MTDSDRIGQDRFAGKGDDFYTALMAAHEGLSEAQSTVLNARLVLILANRVADMGLLEAALRAAAKNLPANQEE